MKHLIFILLTVFAWTSQAYIKDAIKVSDPQVDIGRGLISGVFYFGKFGFNQDVDTAAAEVIWSAGGMWTPMTTAETLTIVSDNAADDAASTGARTITITGLDGDGLELTATYTMDGTNNVVTTGQTWTGVNRAIVASAGSGGVNAGNITITASGAGSVQGYIAAGDSITEQLIFNVPSNKSALVKRFEFSGLKLSGNQAPKLQIRAYYQTNGVTIRAYDAIIDTGVQNGDDSEFPFGISFPPGSKWWVEVETNLDNSFVRGRVEQVLYNTNNGN